ncbi:MAG: FAD-binding domain-containing protein [Anaerolineae bacterium]
MLSEAEVVRAVLGSHSLERAEKFVDEVFWRTYWKGWLEHRPAVWTRYRQDLQRALQQMAGDDRTALLYQAAVAGGTGIDVFDAWARELQETGYLHNHARMWFASIWIFTLDLPWTAGADLFLRHLLDGDPASNTLSWRWVAGLHTSGRPYLARPENIARYLGVPPARPELLAPRASALTEDAPLPPPGLQLPSPSTPRGRVGLLLTEEDLTLEDLPAAVCSVMGVALPAARSPLAVSAAVRGFARDAVSDAGGRASRRLGVPYEGTWDDAGSCGRSCGRDAAPAAAIVDWASRHRLDTVVTAYAPVGPAADLLAELETSLADAGVQLTRQVRQWDRQCWPQTTGGFFRLKKQIPALLAQLGVAAA